MAKRKQENQPATKQRAPAKSKAIRGGTQNKRPSATPAKSLPPRPRPGLSQTQKGLLAGMGLIFLTFVLILSLFSPNQGQMTTALSQLNWRLFGWGGVITPVLVGAIGLYLVMTGMGQRPSLPLRRLIGLGILFTIFTAFATMWPMANENLDVWQIAQAGRGGGYLGGFVAYTLTNAIGNLAAIFILVVVGCVGAILFSGLKSNEITALLKNFGRQSPAPLNAQPSRDIPINPSRSSRPESPSAMSPPPATQAALPIVNTQPPTATTTKPAEPTKTERPSLFSRKPKVEAPQTAETAPSPTPIFIGNTRRGSQHWTLPTIADMLEPGTDNDTNNAAIREQVEVIEHTLESFGAPATVVEINQGPTITQYGVEPSFLEMRNGKRQKVKVGKIAGLADDLALALAARSIRIQAPVPGKGYVGIEVPNSAKALVSLRDVMESAEYQKIKSTLRIGLGQDVAGQPISADLTTMPHLLIAGTTGSGKSVCVNGIIACLLLQNTPDDLKLVMVDPKRVELIGYNGIPHLAAPVVVDMERVIGSLQWALREMDGRYKSFAEVGARNIADYNKRMLTSGGEKLPYIVIFIDELADLMMIAPEDTERSITRLAQMARATGIHVVIATQRPSVDVVTGLIKANFPARIAFAVASSTDSRVILDSTGAERLLGQGDMLFQSPDAAAPQRLQGCFVSDKELARLIEYWKGARRFNLIEAEASIAKKPDPVPSRQPAVNNEQLAVNRQRSSVNSEQLVVNSKQSPTPPPSPVTEGDNHQQPPVAITPAIKPAPKPIVNPAPKTAVSNQPTTVVPPQRPLWEELQAIEINGEKESPYEDDLLPEAIELVRKLNKASTSLLQRRFRIGYTRAARLVDLMEAQGIIGPATGTSKARDVVGGENGSTSETDDSEEEEISA